MKCCNTSDKQVSLTLIGNINTICKMKTRSLNLTNIKINQTSKANPNGNFIEKMCKMSLWLDPANITETKAVYY